MDTRGVWGGGGAITGNGFWCTSQPPQCNPSLTHPHRTDKPAHDWVKRCRSNRGIDGGGASIVWVCVCVCVCCDTTATHTHSDTLVRLAIWKIGPPMHNWLLIHCILLKPSIYQALQFQGPWKKHFASTLQNTLKKKKTLQPLQMPSLVNCQFQHVC